MKRLPNWLRQEIPDMGIIRNRLSMFNGLNIHTVCESAHCPNIFDCFKRNTATFMILGDTCTRDCKFCAVEFSLPDEVNSEEPRNVARAAKALGSKHIVVTSVTRDDLVDGGASQFVKTIKEIRKVIPDGKIEVLIPDFKGNVEPLKQVIEAHPDIIAHNMETIQRLYKTIRKDANYKTSLNVLRIIKEIDNSIVTKSGIMLGLGETKVEVHELLRDLRSVDCDIVTIGQYLSPSENHARVERFVNPDEFEELKRLAISLGFKSVASAPKARSSYHSKE